MRLAHRPMRPQWKVVQYTQFLAFCILAIFGGLTELEAQSLACSERDLVGCVGSSDCMMANNANKNAYTCEAPVNRCQIGFRQAILDPSRLSINNDLNHVVKHQCEARTGCGYVPAAKCYCPPDVVCVCGGGAPPNCVATSNATLPIPTGDFVIVDIRNVSGVAAPLDLNPNQDALGQSLSVSPVGITMEGLDCDEWSIEAVSPVLDFADPLLADVLIGPVDYPQSDGDARLLTSWKYSCEGEVFLSLLQVDARLVVIPWANGSKYLIGEVPLSKTQIAKLQTALADVKFFEGTISGILDTSTLSAVSSWFAYRSSETSPYRFARTSISRNLFDAMGVF